MAIPEDLGYRPKMESRNPGISNPSHDYLARKLKSKLSSALEDLDANYEIFTELRYPYEFPGILESHEEGEFDVIGIIDDTAVVYEVKTGENNIERILSQYERADNFLSSQGIDMDYRILMANEGLKDIRVVLEDEVMKYTDIASELGRWQTGELISAGLLSKLEWLQRGFRKRSDQPERFNQELLEDNEILISDNHILLSTEKLDNYLDRVPDYEEIVHRTPFFDRLYTAGEIGEIIDDSLSALNHQP